ncbi:glycosyltransferase [Mycobacterium hodleri]|uniref:glycosyltransferase n=1 Tax=Mycolicibacterium hodleri TaxID=49897 RepID=UPI0021F301ED|nr:glycosyltransferase [Mycolicibacterium hodleri]MCV7135835.1 glycosyltransferase [Mycolicibacterium hodleri]
MSARPIRLLFVVPDLMVGGAERHVTTLLPRLDPQRFTPSVVCIGDEGGLFADLVAAGVPARALHLGGKLQAGRAVAALTAIMRDGRPDVVVVRGYNAETLGRIAARVAGVAHTVMWVHNIGDATPRSTLRRNVDRALTRWTSAYFGVAEAQRRYLVDDLGYPDDRIRIIHNGVDPAAFDPTTDASPLGEFGWTAGDPVVAIVAELSPIKDHATFLRAARIVVDDMPSARFLVIGDGACRTELEGLCAELGLGSNVHFTGVRRDVGRLLRAVDVFALSSVTVECFSIALLEAMACARPAVCTAVGGIPEMIEDGRTGYLVPPSSPHQLAARIATLLSRPEAARRMGLAGRRRVVAEFSLDRSVDLAQRALEDVVADHALLSDRSR